MTECAVGRSASLQRLKVPVRTVDLFGSAGQRYLPSIGTGRQATVLRLLFISYISLQAGRVDLFASETGRPNFVFSVASTEYSRKAK